MRGNGSIFKRGNVLWMKFYRDGVPVSLSCKTASREVAKSMLKAELRKSDAEFTEPRYKRVTVGELFQLYLDKLEGDGKHDHHKAQTSRWNTYMKATFENMKAAKFDSQAQHDHRKARMAAGAAASTINRELEILSAAFRCGYEMEPPLVKRKPKIHFLKVDNARKVFATPAQLAAIRKECSNPENFKGCSRVTPLHARVFFEVAVLFGWRRNEVLYLKAENIRLVEGTIRIEDSKNGEAREVSMTPSVRTLIEALMVGKKPHERLFPFNAPQIWKTWKRVVKAAGCPEIHIHDLRRTSARSKRAAGVDVSVTMAIMGWKTDGMFRRYGIVAKDDIATALAMQEKYEEQQQQQVAVAAAESVN